MRQLQVECDQLNQCLEASNNEKEELASLAALKEINAKCAPTLNPLSFAQVTSLYTEMEQQVNACECQRDAALDELLEERNARLEAEEARRVAEGLMTDAKSANAALERELAEAIGGWNDTQQQLTLSKSDTARLQEEEMALDRQLLTLSAQKVASEKDLELEYGRLRETLQGMEAALKKSAPHQEGSLKHHAVRLALENLALRRAFRQSRPGEEDKENGTLSGQHRVVCLHPAQMLTTQRGKIGTMGIASKSLGAILVWRLFYDRRRERRLLRCLHAWWGHLVCDTEMRHAEAKRRQAIRELEALHNHSKAHLRIKAYRSLARVLRGLARGHMVSVVTCWASSSRETSRIVTQQRRIEANVERELRAQATQHRIELDRARAVTAVLLRSVAVTTEAAYRLQLKEGLVRLSVWRWYARAVSYRVQFIHALGLRGGALVLGFAIRAWEKAAIQAHGQRLLCVWRCEARAGAYSATLSTKEIVLAKMASEQHAERQLGRARLLVMRLGHVRARAERQVWSRLLRCWCVSTATAYTSNILDAAERRVREVRRTRPETPV